MFKARFGDQGYYPLFATRFRPYQSINLLATPRQSSGTRTQDWFGL